MRNRDLSFWLFLSPVLICLIAVVIIPLLNGLFYSFTDWNGLSLSKFVGLDNYLKLFSDSEFMTSF